jgi:hypothetical protein
VDVKLAALYGHTFQAFRQSKVFTESTVFEKGQAMFRVIVAGSRELEDFELLQKKLDAILANKLPNVTILSGGARGADELGERYAKERGLQCQVYKAEWEMYGKAAGLVRNTKMADEGHALVAFWNGWSPGTRHMIDIANEVRLPIRVIRFQGDIHF